MSNGVTIKIDLQTGGAEFAHDVPGTLAAFLHGIAERVGNGEPGGRIMDSNGGSIGSYGVWAEPETCVYCGKSVTFDPLDHSQVTDSDGLPDCWDAPRRPCQACGSNGEGPGCSECDDTECSWMGIHAVREDGNDET